MKLKHAWDTAKTADKTNGAPDVELKSHLKATQQEHLPQADLLQGCFEMLRDKGLLEEAYLRGSIGRGHADHHSDIDLFTVVDPKRLPEVYDAVSEFLASRGRVVTVCHDRLVENYGGIGFMFIAQSAAHDNMTYQFDLYMAMKGQPPQKPTSIKPRIYSNDPDYKWTEQYGKQPAELPQVAKDFIKEHTTGTNRADRMELMMQEMMINLYVTHKHIKRGQMSRTVVDNHAIVTSAIEFLQVLTEYRPTGYSPVYLGNEIVNFTRKHGDDEMVKAADKLEKLFTQKVTDRKLVDALDFATDVLKGAHPEKYEAQKEAIRFFREEVLLNGVVPKHLKRSFGLPANDAAPAASAAAQKKPKQPRP